MRIKSITTDDIENLTYREIKTDGDWIRLSVMLTYNSREVYYSGWFKKALLENKVNEDNYILKLRATRVVNKLLKEESNELQ